MSTLAYAVLTNKREAAIPGTSTNSAAPGVKTWVDSLASLVPSEVLAIHAALLSVTTETKVDQGHAITTITDPNALRLVFYCLVALSIILYGAGRIFARAWDHWDFARVCIPPLAFVGWTMIQKSTAFDAAFPQMSSTYRTIAAVLGAVILGLAASALAYRADQKTPGS